MDALADLPYRALSPTQRATLGLMEVDLYQRRQLARAPTLTPTAGWTEQEAELPLAKAIAKAAGVANGSLFCAQWLAAGWVLPTLSELRDGARKKALWQQLRLLRR